MTNYITFSKVQVWKTVGNSGIPSGKREELAPFIQVRGIFDRFGYTYIDYPVSGYIKSSFLNFDTSVPNVPPPSSGGDNGLYPAIDANMVWSRQTRDPELAIPNRTYANILLQPKIGAKDGNIPLTRNEIKYIRDELLKGELAKWNWVVGSNHTKFIYLQDDITQKVVISSISGWYSNSNAGSTNKFKVLRQLSRWYLEVETLVAGSGWENAPIPEHCLQQVWTLKDNLILPPKYGEVLLPLITRTGKAIIRTSQLMY